MPPKKRKAGAEAGEAEAGEVATEAGECARRWQQRATQLMDELKKAIEEKEAAIKERDDLIADRNKALKTSAILLWMIEGKDDDDNTGGDNKQTVPSSTTTRTYDILYDNVKECYTCSCPDYMYRRANKNEMCKHLTKLKEMGKLPIQPV